MRPLSWLLMAGLISAVPVYASTADLLWTSGIPLVCLLLLVVALTIYSWKLQRSNTSLLIEQQTLQRFLQQSDDVIAILNNERQAVYLNPQLSDKLTDVKQLPFYLDSQCTRLLLPELELDQNWQGEAWLQVADGSCIALSLAITQQQQNEQSYLLIGRDISQWQLLQQQAEYGYMRDQQTGLQSQALLTEQLQTCIEFCNEHHPRFALLLLKFSKLLTAQSDKPAESLQNLIQPLSEQLKLMTNSSYILGRYGIDTFAVIVPPHLCNQRQPEINLNRLGYKLLSLTDRITPIGNKNAFQTIVGISIYPADGKNPAELLLAAQKALQYAARMGHNGLQFADASIQQRTPEYLAFETELQKALLQDEFDVYYQPRISIASNRVTGYEALLRWHSPKRGTLMPQHFISIADDTGLSVQLDKLVFKKCCGQLQYWQQTGMNRGRISLNVAIESFKQNDFVEQLAAQLTESGINADQFELELHEDILLQPDSSAGKKLLQLTALGFHLTLDNFGTGVSSLSALQNFPLHGLKIAPAFVKDMEHNEQQRNITASLIRLASYLQLDVIASGIENEMQAYLLHVMGCDILQGHLFSKALPAAEIPALLARENKLLRKEVS